MDRRRFLANALKAAAATAVAAGTVSLVPDAESNEPAKIADFTSGMLRRSFDERGSLSSSLRNHMTFQDLKN